MNRRDLSQRPLAALAPLTVAAASGLHPQRDARAAGGVPARRLRRPPTSSVPCPSDFYHNSPASLGIAKPDAAIRIPHCRWAPDWGLHPILRDSIYPLWAKREIAFVPFAAPPMI